ncbi:MAG: hypothetical protein HY712_04185 [candidate division NC10 bacterium]|nr:hypothetical protein [candidate division NC10 bacterium]
MKVVEAVSIGMELDPWMGLEALSGYSGMSVRSLRAYLADPEHPLPCYRMKEPHVIQGKDGRRRAVSGKILVRRSDFDKWMAAFRHVPDVDKIVNDVLADMRITSSGGKQRTP